MSNLHTIFYSWYWRKWKPTPMFLPGKPMDRGPGGLSPQVTKESNSLTEWLNNNKQRTHEPGLVDYSSPDPTGNTQFSFHFLWGDAERHWCCCTTSLQPCATPQTPHQGSLCPWDSPCRVLEWVRHFLLQQGNTDNSQNQAQQKQALATLISQTVTSKSQRRHRGSLCNLRS